MMRLSLALVTLLGTLPSAYAEEEKKNSSYHHGGIELPGSMRLNGRFDLNYERIRYNSNPLEGRDAFRNYHHFVFLSRRTQDDPISFNAELVDLSFYEISFRHKFGDALSVRAKGGKILVPFGAEPLFHNMYGGRAGFDHRFLPIIWARHGVTTNARYRFGPFNFTNDLYTVHGFKLSEPDGVINLQSDVAPDNEMKMAVGDRLGASWGPISAWYSVYFQRIGFNRRLVLQALDVSIWRPRFGLPLLDRFALSAGVVRADVTGGEKQGHGGHGKDYYHFADYVQLRYYPLDELYVQLRSGLRTMNNRRGNYIDDTRLDENDTSSHNVAVVYQYHGLTLGVYHFWNFEKRSEQRDDFLRVTVAYVF